MTTNSERKFSTTTFISTDEKLKNDRWKFELGNHIVARGQFGILYMSGKHLSKTAALKHAHADEFCKDNFKALVKELKVLSLLNPHPNILKLIGSYASIENKEVILAFEFCSNGNLLKMLRNSRSYYKNIFTKNDPVGPDRGDTLHTHRETPVLLNFTAWNLLQWTLEITEAMEFLAYNKIVHGDLATRNILVSCIFKIKLCNFCLAKQLPNDKSQEQEYDYSKLILPLEWLAPEAIRKSHFSLESDVWSFGIVMWEIFSLGQVPYPEIPDIEVNEHYWKYLITGYRLKKPMCATTSIYQIMLKCWNNEPKQRPSFSTVRQLVLQQIYKNSKR